MNVNYIDAIFDNLFAGGYPEGEGPEPINKRFNWVDPKTGKRPPKIPRGAMPNSKQRQEVEGEPVPVYHDCRFCGQKIPPGSTSIAAMGALVCPHCHEDQDPQNIGTPYSLDDLIPPNEVANMDQLLDLKLRAQKAQGPQRDALNREFDAHRSEFESLVKKIVDVILEGAYERSFNNSVRGIRTSVDKANKEMDQLFKELPVGSRGADFKPKEPEGYYDQHSKLVQADRRANRAAGRYPGNPRRAAAAKRAAQRLTGHENRFGE